MLKCICAFFSLKIECKLLTKGYKDSHPNLRPLATPQPLSSCTLGPSTIPVHPGPWAFAPAAWNVLSEAPPGCSIVNIWSQSFSDCPSRSDSASPPPSLCQF